MGYIIKNVIDCISLVTEYLSSDSILKILTRDALKKLCPNQNYYFNYKVIAFLFLKYMKHRCARDKNYQRGQALVLLQ